MSLFTQTNYDEPPLNEEIYHLIEEGDKVLDVGCASGKLAEKLKNSKRCFVVGIEQDRTLFEIARHRCDEVLNYDLDNFEGLPFEEGYFDVMIFADILEHLKAPNLVLSKLRDYLKDDGAIVVSIPNVANWMIRLKLLFGRFEYTGGVLDPGHLRFFTCKTAMRLIEESGFRIVHIGTRNRHLKLAGRLFGSLFAFQFIIKAVKV